MQNRVCDFVGGHDPKIPQRREQRYSENILSELVSLNETRPSKLSSKDFEGTFSILTFVGPSTLYCNFERRVSLNDRAFSISGINFFHGVIYEGLYYHFDYSQTRKCISIHLCYFRAKENTRSLLAPSVPFSSGLGSSWRTFFSQVGS